MEILTNFKSIASEELFPWALKKLYELNTLKEAAEWKRELCKRVIDLNYDIAYP